jgi:hypothetical protein
METLRRAVRGCRVGCLLSCITLASCGGGGGEESSGNSPPPADQTYLSAPGTSRVWLSANDLTSVRLTPASPLHNGHFMPIGAGTAAPAPFSGTIRVTSTRLETSVSDPGANAVDIVFPNVEMRFISDGNELIPLDRDFLTGTNSSVSRIILGPGTIWTEPGDNGWTRASFPFDMTPIRTNIARNGIATFIYSGSQISAIRLQMTQESAGAAAAMAEANVWGTLTAQLTPQIFANGASVIADYHAEKAGYLPTGSWSDLAAQLKVDPNAIYGKVPSEKISLIGVVKDGVIYRAPCRTRFGDYPYCQQLRAGSFSVAKSMGAAVALLRLAQKYGDGIGDLLIKDYVNVTATHHGWDHVTFLNALNMATGMGTNASTVPVGLGQNTFADENTSFADTVFRATGGAAGILNVAFTEPAYSWGPGVEMRYNSIHTFILSAAMDAFLKQKEGPDAHLWDMVFNEVYKPIGIMHAPMKHTIEPDGSRGIPQMFIGLYPTADDVAKLAQLFHDGGMFNGQQLLSANLTAIAMYRTANQGMRAYAGYDNQYGMSRYLMSFWSLPWSDGKGCNTRVPHMSGLGGNVVALLPNGLTVYRFTHANDYDANPLQEVGAAAGGMCD